MEKVVDEDIIIIGTAHVSPKSVEEVREAIEKYNPKAVAIELDERRLEVLKDGEKRWEKTPLTQLIKGRNAYFFMGQALLTSMQRRMGKEFGVEPGTEMLTAAEGAGRIGAKLIFADRDITITLQKAWRLMRFREKMRLWWEMMKLMVPEAEEKEEDKDGGENAEGEGGERSGEEKYKEFKKRLEKKGATKETLDLEELMEEDILTAMMEELRQLAPTVAEVLINERDIYISKKIVDAYRKHGRVVAVVGAGHVAGIERYVKRLLGRTKKKKKLPSYKQLNLVPEQRVNWLKVVGYAIPALFITLVIYLILVARWEDLRDVLFWWIMINGICAMAGAILAWGHPATWVVAFLAAPWTSLNPAIAAGWVAGAAELFISKPENKDLLELMSGDYEFFRQYYNNKVFKVLLVTAFVNFGSMIGTFVAGTKIVTDICI